jgi:Lysylphosphatidylglycerol synthase TM region
VSADGSAGLRRRARQALPWLAAVALFGWLLHRVPLGEVQAALGRGPYLLLLAYVFLEYLVTLPADAFATREALAVVGVRRTFAELMLARAATYLLGLLSYFASLGGIGFWVAKGGTRAARATGSVLLLMVTNGMAIVLVAAAGLLADLPAGGLKQIDRELLLLLIGGALLGMVLYLVVIAARLRWLAGWGFLAPLFEAGVAGHLRATAARLPHMLVLAVLHWGAFRVWGIGVPFLQGTALMAVVLLLSALPITPNGLGTTQILQVLFFSAWAQGPTAEARGADVLAFSLVHWAFSLLWQLAIGLAGLALLRRQGAAPETEAQVEVEAP